MDNSFFSQPVLNSPYEYPSRHWELDESGQPTNRIVDVRRRVSFVSPIPKPKKRRGAAGEQAHLVYDEASRWLAEGGQQYDLTAIINEVRRRVDAWRGLDDPGRWGVTPETARLLQHWRHHRFSGLRPFFCQVEAVETAIWLTEVAPQASRAGRDFLDHLANANRDANPDLPRLALKLATGAGKTTVMAMLIAWQAVNAARRPQSSRFARSFLVVTPGITIKDRLRVLQPNDPDSYYRSRELVPTDMLPDLDKARIVITNYHGFKLRDRLELSKGGRVLLQGRGEPLAVLETEGQMLQRVMPELMGAKGLVVLNDEAHHCYREKPGRGRRGRPERRRPQGSGTQPRSGAPVDIRAGNGAATARRQSRLRPLGDAVFPARLRLRRGHAVPLDDERFLPHGRYRMRYRQAAPRAGGRQHSRRRHAEIPQPLGTHRQADAQEGARQGRRTRPAQPSCRVADRPRSPLRPLRKAIRAVAEGGPGSAALLYSSFATIHPPRSSSTTTFRASSATTPTVPGPW